MYNMKADLQKNRLYVTVEKSITSIEVEAYKADIKKNISILKPNFTALLDLRKASVFDQDTMRQLHGTKDIAVSLGLSKSAMVVESAVLKMQMNRNFKNVGPQDKAFNDIDEAESFLNE